VNDGKPLVLAFETQLVKTHLTPVERRDAEKTYNKFASVAELPGVGLCTSNQVDP
jgi:predicted metalloendopeptidase